MKQYAGIDVSLKSSSVCVVDVTGRIVRESKLPVLSRAMKSCAFWKRCRAWARAALTTAYAAGLRAPMADSPRFV